MRLKTPQSLRDLRLPLEGHFDLTYRCNNDCCHCWLRLPADDPARGRELSLDEIKDIVDQARALGTRRWSISGGEPLLRPDFPEIFDTLTARAVSYTLNTNGTLITPQIARLLKRKGTKLVAFYGATPETYDRVTRRPGGFEKVMRGFRYLKEAGAAFIVQLIPMRENWHEWQKMIELAKSLSHNWRVGAAWLYLSACRDPDRNAEIARQRLDPRDVVELDPPDLSSEKAESHSCGAAPAGKGLFADCIAGRHDFHIDPYGGMTFCSFIRDPALRYDLRRGSFREAWETFIPSLADKARGDAEYDRHCASCERRADCRWCPVYGWLEHGRYSAPVEYLCRVAEESRRYKEEWRARHRRHFEIAGITLQVDSDLPINDGTFHPKFEAFRVQGPGPDTVTIRHHFALPDLKDKDLGRELYRKPPWAIYQKNGSFVYLGISPRADDPSLHRVAAFNRDHTKARIYNDREEIWRKGNIHSLTMFPSDQILIARLLADRQGCYIHSAGAILNSVGMLFVGHSEAGKSTITRQLLAARDEGRHEIEILCDDRNIVRLREGGWRVFGTWSHGEIPDISAASAPLGALLFLEKAAENSILPLTDSREVTRRLLACIIKPLVTADWWNKTLELVEKMVREVPCYAMRFDKSGAILDELAGLKPGKEEERRQDTRRR